MQIIKNINSITFTHNGKKYIKNFIVIKQGENNIAIHNSFDTRHQLVSSTHYNQFTVDDVVYTNQNDLMSALAPLLFSKSGINGDLTTTSQLLNDGENGIHPFITANDLPQSNKIENQNGYTLSADTLTVNSGWYWLVQNVQYTNASDVIINVPAVSSGMTRNDLIVATTGNTFVLVQGDETDGVAIAPPTPNNTLVATYVYSSDEGSTPSPTPIGGDYITKLEKNFLTHSVSGSSLSIELYQFANNYFDGGIVSVNDFKFFSSMLVRYDHQIYVGKEYIFYNKQATDITLKHNTGTNIKMKLVNQVDYVLKPFESVRFLYTEDFNFLQIKEIDVATVVNASETQSGIVNTTTQSFAGNKSIKGESTLTGNVLSLKDSANTPIINFGNNKSMTVGDKFIFNLTRSTNFSVDSPRIRFTGGNTRLNDIYADQEYIYITGALRVLDTYNQGFVVKSVNFFGNEGTATSPNLKSSNGIRGGIYLTRFLEDGATYIGFSTSENNETPVQRVVIDKLGALVVGGANLANSSSVLQVDSTTKGSLPFPRITQAQRLAITTPAIGLHVYQTDTTEGVYVNKSTGWVFAY
jgi:hypothetical protein